MGIHHCTALELVDIMRKSNVYADLIYIDPPFGIPVDKKFGMDPWKENHQEVNNADKLLPMGILSKGEQNYLRWIYKHLASIYGTLADTGTMCVHVDQTFGHYIKILLDGLFGRSNFLNEISWCYTGPSATKKNFPSKKDTIFIYVKDKNNYCFNVDKAYVPHKSLNYSSRYGTFNKEELLKRGKVIENYWTDITLAGRSSIERTGYPTQKPEKLLRRFIEIFSHEDDLVVDFFGGSGTTAVVSDKLNRHWLTCDPSKEAISVIKNRIFKNNKNEKNTANVPGV